MVELYHALRPGSSYERGVQQWYGKIRNEGLLSEKSLYGEGSDYIFLFEDGHPPSDNLLTYPAVRVEVDSEDINVRSWWTEDSEAGVESYREWDGEYSLGTEFLVEDRIDPENLYELYREGLYSRTSVSEASNMS